VKPTRLHLLLTCRCTHECDHCFVWGGPAELARMAGLSGGAYADACHLCDASRRALRPRFHEILTPDAFYQPL
jgi:hypothetical protein